MAQEKKTALDEGKTAAAHVEQLEAEKLKLHERLEVALLDCGRLDGELKKALGGDATLAELRRQVAELQHENAVLQNARARGPAGLVLRDKTVLRGREQQRGFVLLSGQPARGLTTLEIDKAIARGVVTVKDL